MHICKALSIFGLFGSRSSANTRLGGEEPVAPQVLTDDVDLSDEKVGFPDSCDSAVPWNSIMSVAKAKAKVKTRGSAVEDEEAFPLGNLPIHDAVSEEHPTFKFKARDVKVFRTLFYQPTHCNNIKLGQVKRLDFLHVMANVGTSFTYQKLRSSAWQFTPTPGLGLHRGIGLHEPQPGSKLAFCMAHHFGRHLGRVYGWNRDTFVAE